MPIVDGHIGADKIRKLRRELANRIVTTLKIPHFKYNSGPLVLCPDDQRRVPTRDLRERPVTAAQPAHRPGVL